MIKCIVNHTAGTLVGPFPISFLKTISSLSGRKSWKGSSRVAFEATAFNLRRVKESDEQIEFEDQTGSLAEIEELQNLSSQHAIIDDESLNFTPGVPLRDYQKKALALSSERNAYGYFLEMGLGKTAIAIANIGFLVKKKKLTGVLVLSPKGVHRQWIEEQIPEHMDKSIRCKSTLWSGKRIELKRSNADVEIFSMNIDGIRTIPGRHHAEEFLKMHAGSSMMIIDESHLIKTASAQRTKAAWALGRLADYRRIMTGTPLAKNVADLWAQFKFLDERILGHRYFISFRNQYCIMGGFEQKQIVGQKNTEELYALIAPHSFRLTKDEALDLPPKIYIKRVYAMNEASRKHYESLKKTFMTQLSDGSVLDVPNAVSCLVRLQQICSGYLPTENEDFEIFSDDRIQQLMEIVEQTNGPMVIWSRFTQDIIRITEKLNKSGYGRAVAYYGGNVSTRNEGLKAFMDGEARFFVSNPAAGGTGLNLQGSGCQTVVFVNNDFNYITRAQAEDRTHRLGTRGAVTYFDLIAEKTLDKSVLRNLESKKSVSSFTLDQIRQALLDE